MKKRKMSEVRAVSEQHGCVVVKLNPQNDLRVALYNKQHNFITEVNPFSHKWKHKPTNVDFVSIEG